MTLGQTVSPVRMKIDLYDLFPVAPAFVGNDDFRAKRFDILRHLRHIQNEAFIYETRITQSEAKGIDRSYSIFFR